MTTISPTSTVSTGSVSNALDNTEIASNFTTFLQLPTTQLKNQNPLDPLDTNQFTQQPVEFAQVEQQMKSNDQLSSQPGIPRKERASDHRACVCRGDCRCGRFDGPTDEQHRQLEPQRQQAVHRHNHHQGFDWPKRLHRHGRGQSGSAEFHLERPRQ
jgi:hypothetical protein